MEIIEEQFEESSTLIGIKPITDKMIQIETQQLIKSGKMDKNTDYNNTKKTAVKNLVTRFLDYQTRNEIHIVSLHSSKTENSPIIYLKCESTEDIAIITSHAKHLSNTNFDIIPAGIVHHVPQIMYKRYQHCKKMLWKLRLCHPQQLMTKIRMGTRDFILRYKKKEMIHHGT